MKRLFAVLAIASVALVGAGCASKPKVPDGGSYTRTVRPDKTVVEETRSSYAIQADDLRDARASVKPILEIEALDGQTIELKGVKRLAVYNPSSGGQGAPALGAPAREASAFEKALAVADKTLQYGLQGLGLVYNYRGVVANVNANRDIQLGQQRMTVDVANSVGSSNAQIAGFIQAPPGTTYNLNGGSFMTLGDNSPLTHSSNNPTTTTTTRTCSGGAGASSGAGSTSTTGAGAPSGTAGAGGSASC